MNRLITLSIVLFFGFTLRAQVSLKFCVEVQKEGGCDNESSQFFISKDGGTISFLITKDAGLNLTDVRYKIFKLDSLGTESYASTIDQKVDKKWNFAWQEAVFYDPGNYKIKVYDMANNESLICSNTLTLLVQ